MIESSLDRFSPQATDQTFVEKLNYHFGSTKHECYSINRNNKSSFTIHHYAGKVSYCALGFLEKNRDTLSDSVVDMFKHSQDDLIRLLFHGNASDGANSLSKGVRHSEWNCFFILRFIVVTTSYCCRERCSKSIDCRCTISSKYFEKVSQDEFLFQSLEFLTNSHGSNVFIPSSIHALYQTKSTKTSTSIR